jgi:hypothetical protein
MTKIKYGEMISTEHKALDLLVRRTNEITRNVFNGEKATCILSHGVVPSVL